MTLPIIIRWSRGIIISSYSSNQTNEEITHPEIIYVHSNDKVNRSSPPISYHYELGKLVDRSDSTKFRFFASLLKDKCKDNELVLAEIENMELNFHNILEYYCSFYLVDKELNGPEKSNPWYILYQTLMHKRFYKTLNRVVAVQECDARKVK